MRNWSRNSRRLGRRHDRGRTLAFETLETRELLSAAPLAVDDTYIVAPGTILDLTSTPRAGVDSSNVVQEVQAFPIAGGVSESQFAISQHALAIISGDGRTLTVYDTRTKGIITAAQSDLGLRSVTLSPDERYLFVVEGVAPYGATPLTGSVVNWVHRYDFVTNTWTQNTFYEPINNVQSTPNGLLLLTAQTLENPAYSLLAITTYNPAGGEMQRLDGYTYPGNHGGVKYIPQTGQVYLTGSFEVDVTSNTGGSNLTHRYYLGYERFSQFGYYSATGSVGSVSISVPPLLSSAFTNTPPANGGSTLIVSGDGLSLISAAGVNNYSSSSLSYELKYGTAPQGILAATNHFALTASGIQVLGADAPLATYPAGVTLASIAVAQDYTEFWGYDANAGMLRDYRLDRYWQGLLDNDVLPADGLVKVASTGPAEYSPGRTWSNSGKLSVAPAGGFTYSPPSYYNGKDVFSYVLTTPDGTQSQAQATFIVDTPPVAGDDQVIAGQDTPSDLSLLENDTFVPNLTNAEVYTVRIVTPPTHGQIVTSPRGYVKYTPDPGYLGNDAFTYKLFDGLLESNAASVAVRVRPVNLPPTVTPVVPIARTTYAGAGVHIGAWVGDPDNEGGNVSVLVEIGRGSGTLVYRVPGQADQIAGNGVWVYLTDTLANVNDKLSKIVFFTNAGADSTNTISVTINDLGSSDKYGGPKTAKQDFQVSALNKPYFNYLQPFDVNRDGMVTALDALLVMNTLNNRGRIDLLNDANPPAFAVDCNGDFQVTAVDVLQIINYLNLLGIVVNATGSSPGGSPGPGGVYSGWGGSITTSFSNFSGFPPYFYLPSTTSLITTGLNSVFYEVGTISLYFAPSTPTGIITIKDTGELYGTITASAGATSNTSGSTPTDTVSHFKVTDSTAVMSAALQNPFET